MYPAALNILKHCVQRILQFQGTLYLNNVAKVQQETGNITCSNFLSTQLLITWISQSLGEQQQAAFYHM
jgi:hypothetical protein